MSRRRPWIVVAIALVLGAALAVVFQGCTEAPTILIACPDAKFGTYDPRCSECSDLSLPGCCEGYYDNDDNYVPPPAVCPDGGADAGDASASITPRNGTCSGECVATPPLGWEGPALLWLGAEGNVPACPNDAPIGASLGHADLVTPSASCTACTCSPSSGSCAPPLVITTSAATCAAGGAPARTFSPPPDWDGNCTAFDPIVASDFCNGAPCTVSLTAGPLLVTDTGCTPSIPALSSSTPTWTTAALACSGAYSVGGCGSLALTCGPSAAQSPGFAVCISQQGTNDCPASYPVKHLVYSSFTDARGCAPCTCGASDGSCSAKLDVYPDGTCTPPDSPFGVALTSAGPSCAAINPPGSALGSKMIATLAYHPATCPPDGGQLVGDVEPSGAATFCCLS
jgi:hypothetical protein